MNEYCGYIIFLIERMRSRNQLMDTSILITGWYLYITRCICINANKCLVLDHEVLGRKIVLLLILRSVKLVQSFFIRQTIRKQMFIWGPCFVHSNSNECLLCIVHKWTGFYNMHQNASNKFGQQRGWWQLCGTEHWFTWLQCDLTRLSNNME